MSFWTRSVVMVLCLLPAQLVASVDLTLSKSPASGYVSYCYEGKTYDYISPPVENNFYKYNDRVSACVVLPGALSPNTTGHFYVSIYGGSNVPFIGLFDGFDHQTGSNSTIFMTLTTNGQGQITDWSFLGQNQDDQFPFNEISSTPAGDLAVFAIFRASSSSPGSWTEQFGAVPEPSSLSLLLVVLIPLGIMTRRARHRRDALPRTHEAS